MTTSTNAKAERPEASPGVAAFDDRHLYTIGGVAALLIPLVYVLTAAVNAYGYNANPFPTTVADWYAQFQQSWLVGVVYLGFADVVIMLLAIPLFLALCRALWRSSPSGVLIATVLAVVGAAVYLATNTGFTMLALSHQYAAATTEAAQSELLAAGRATLAAVDGTARYLGMPLVWVACIMVSAVMRRSAHFSRAAAYIGIVAFLLLIASAPLVSYTTTDPKTTVESVIVAVSYAGGGLLSLLWYVLIGWRLLRLRRTESARTGG